MCCRSAGCSEKKEGNDTSNELTKDNAPQSRWDVLTYRKHGKRSSCARRNALLSLFVERQMVWFFALLSQFLRKTNIHYEGLLQKFLLSGVCAMIVNEGNCVQFEHMLLFINDHLGLKYMLKSEQQQNDQNFDLNQHASLKRQRTNANCDNSCIALVII